MRIACLVLLVGLAEAIAGCGQKGPLVLPDAQRAHKKIGVPKPPASAAPPPAAPAGLPSPRSTPTDPTATGEAKTTPVPPR
jgi:predicted small lipoprotein YifL